MIGFFDSGFGGLTVLRSVVDLLPEYDYLYLGDNARVPYGTRSQNVVYEFTRQAVDYLFKQQCPLIIIACNTSSARALRKIQQEFLPETYPDRRVLGVIRPAAEELAERNCRKVGILATEGVVASNIYVEELMNLGPSIKVFQQACPLLVPIIEAGEKEWEGTDMIIGKYLSQLFGQDGEIDTILLACTHYPIVHENFERAVSGKTIVLDQGPIVARKLKDYLKRHPEVDDRLTKKGTKFFLTTDISDKFDHLARIFYGESIHSKLITLESLCF
ncbi:MAG: glutamate racemase [Deltaproteobacteria bacterium]|nr:glutamate racemase [Deltaproteobacteria bacterium]